MPDIYTERLNIRKIQPTDYFISDTFNAILDDIDAKVLGIDHLETALHWTEWEEGTAYERNDVVRWVGMKSHQYAKCLTGGISGTTSPGNNVTGSVLTEGTVTWKVMSLTEATDTTGPIVLWLGGTQYSRGDVALYANALYRSKIDHTASGTFEPDEDKWTEIYSSIRPWSMNKYYYLNDTVIVDNIIYKCNTAHTSKATFDNVQEIPTWTVVGNLARAMEWQPNTYYLAEQLITKNGLLYRAIETHTSDGVDFVNDSLKWEPVFASIIPWTSNAWYDQDVVVSYNNILYRCIEPHTSSANFDYSKWQLLHDPNAFIRNWVGSTYYEQYQVVKYNDNIYWCNTTNNDATWDITKWTLLTDSINDWVASVDYVVGQYVNYKGSLYKCIIANNDANFTTAKWQKVSGGGIDTWTSNNDYSVGDIVVYNNKIYSCNTGHTSGATFIPDEDKWTEISACITRIPDWEITTDYVVGDLVAHDAKIYRCITAHTSGSTWDATEEAKWEELSPTINEISAWTPSTDYEVGQLVIYNNKLYRCNTDHTSTSSFNDDTAYWDEIGASGIEPWKVNEAYKQGSMVVYDNRIYVCDTAHTSADPFDPTKWHEVSKNVIVDWQSSTKYYEDQPLEYSDTLFRANKDFTSGSTVSADNSNMDFVYANLSPWKSGVYYRQGSIVVYSDNNIYKCIQSHTSSNGVTPVYATNTFNNVATYGKEKPTLPNSQVLDLGASKYITHIYGLQAGGYAGLRNVNIYGSLDDISYDFVHNFTDSNAREGTVFEADVSGYYRYIKVNVISGWDGHSPGSTGNWGVSFTPFTIYTESEYWVRLDKTLIEKYAQAKNYPKNTPVIYKGKLYVANTDITNSSATLDPTKWDEVGGSGLDEWQPSTEYTLGNIVVKDNQIYKCTTAHTSDSSDFDADIANWLLLDTKWKAENWVASKLYTANEVVLYDNRLFKCVSTHTSAVDFATDANYWKALSAKLEPWKASTYYTVGDTVINNNKLYKCIVAHTSDSTSISANLSNWEIVGSSGIDAWKANEDYTTSSVVIYNNKIYKCNASHTSGSTFDPTKWDEISSYDIGLWQASTSYKVGNLVIKDGQIYRCITAHTSATFNNETANWELLDTKWIAKNWSASTLYFANSVIVYNGTVYRANTTHVSGTSFEEDKSKWDILNANIRTWTAGISYKIGDIVLKDKELLRCKVANNDIGYKRQNWELISKCHAGMWKAGPDPDILALLHFEIASDIGYNEYGSSFSTNGSISLSSGKWGTGGYLHGNSGSSVTSPSYSFTNGETYTIEFWFNFQGDPFYHGSFGYIDSLGTFMLDGYNPTIFSGTSYSYVLPNEYSYYHRWLPYALVISPTTCNVFINGILVHSFTRPNSNPVAIRFSVDNSGYYDGYVDEVRITKRALYTSDYTPQNSPFASSYSDGYEVGDIVVYEDKIYRCITANNDMEFTPSKWVEISKSEIPYWTSGNDYYTNSVVIYNNSLYIAVSDIINSVVNPLQDTTNWVPVNSRCIDFWKANKQYEIEDIVMYNSADEYNFSNNYVGGEIVKKGNTTYVVSTDPSIEYDLTSVTTSSPIVTIEPGITATVSSVNLSNFDNIFDSSLTTYTDINTLVEINIAFSSPVNVDLVNIYGGQQLNARYKIEYTDSSGNLVDVGYKHLYPEGTTSGNATYYSDYAWYNTAIAKDVSNIKLTVDYSSSSYGISRIHQIKLIKTANPLVLADDSAIDFYYCAVANNDSTFDDSKWQKIDVGGGGSIYYATDSDIDNLFK